MKKEDFLEKLGEIDEAYIEEASHGLRKKKPSVYKVLSGISAAAAVILMIVGIGHMTDRSKSAEDGLTSAIKDEAYYSDGMQGIDTNDGKSGDMDARAEGQITEFAPVITETVTECVNHEGEAEDSTGKNTEQQPPEEALPLDTPTGEDAPTEDLPNAVPISGEVYWEVAGLHSDNTENDDFSVILQGSAYESMKQEGTDFYLVLKDGTVKECLERKEKDGIFILLYKMNENPEGLSYQIRDKNVEVLSEEPLMVFECSPEDIAHIID